MIGQDKDAISVIDDEAFDEDRRPLLQQQQDLVGKAIDGLATATAAMASSSSQTSLRVALGDSQKPLKTHIEPPDGGIKAWTVMVCSFLCNGIIFGILNSCSSIYVALKEMYNSEHDPDAATKASLIGSLAIGATFALSPVSGILSDKFGIRRTAFFGGFIATLGMFLSSFCIDNIEALCFTYGIMFGGGAALVYSPSVVIIGHYFKRRIGVVSGVVAAGSSVFTAPLPHVLTYVLKQVGIANTFRIMAAMVSLLMVSALSFKPLLPLHKSSEKVEDAAAAIGRKRSKCYSLAAKIVYLDNWKNTRYVIWCLAVPVALFGYFVPYMHMPQYVKDTLPGWNGDNLITCLAVTSFLGRLLFGKIVDHHRANGVVLQQVALVVIGSCTMLLIAAQYFGQYTYYGLVTFVLIMGLFDGCFITMFGPIAFQICGPKGASQGIGFIFGLNSLPLTIGPMVAGMLYDRYGNYMAAFLFAGLPPIVGAIAMCLIHRVGSKSAAGDDHADLESIGEVDSLAAGREVEENNQSGPLTHAATVLREHSKEPHVNG